MTPSERNICGPTLFLKKHLDRNDQQKNRKAFAQTRLRNLLRPFATEVAAEKEAQGYPQGHFQVRVAGLVVFPESQKADGRQQRSQRSALRALLGHVEAIDQSGNNHHAPADSDQTGENSNQETEYQRDSYGHLQSLVKLEKKIRNFAIVDLAISKLKRVSKTTMP